MTIFKTGWKCILGVCDGIAPLLLITHSRAIHTGAWQWPQACLACGLSEVGKQKGIWWGPAAPVHRDPSVAGPRFFKVRRMGRLVKIVLCSKDLLLLSSGAASVSQSVFRIQALRKTPKRSLWSASVQKHCPSTPLLREPQGSLSNEFSRKILKLYFFLKGR